MHQRQIRADRKVRRTTRMDLAIVCLGSLPAIRSHRFQILGTLQLAGRELQIYEKQ
jgi:hypothetical protein